MRGAALRRRWPLLGLLTLLTYNTWVLWAPVNGHVAIINGYLSELSASDQPHNLFFRGGDLATSLIVGALGLRALAGWPRLTPPRRRWWQVAAAALILFGVSTLLDSFFSMDCSPTLSQVCKVAEETGRLSAIHYAHTYTSVGAQTGIVASMVAAFLALARAPHAWPLLRRWVLAVAVAEVAALTVMMVMLAAGIEGLGYPQGFMVTLASVWFAGVGVVLARDPAPARAGPPLVSPPRQDHHVH